MDRLPGSGPGDLGSNPNAGVLSWRVYKPKSMGDFGPRGPLGRGPEAPAKGTSVGRDCSRLAGEDLRKLIMWNLVTLDGFFEGRKSWDIGWHDTVWGEELEKFSLEQSKSIGALLFGRVTYEGMAGYWSKEKGDIADFMNAVPKVVFSKTLAKADWNNTRLVKQNAEREVAKMKNEKGKDLFIFGSANLSSALTRKGLIDSLGDPDGEAIDREEFVAATRRIARALSVPLSADIVGGFGRSPKEVVSTVRSVIEAGAIGINIEDSVHETKELLPIPAQVERLNAVRKLRDALDVPFVINARTDALSLAPGER